MGRNKLDFNQLKKICNRMLEGNPGSKDIENFNDWYYSFDDREVRLPSENSKSDTRDKIKAAIDENLGFSPPTCQARILKTILKWAACLLLVACSFYLYSNLENSDNRSPTSDNLISKSTGPGQRLTIVLPDSSTVKLNSNSKVSYAANFNESQRVVNLEGEAFFSVTKSERFIDFTVHTDQLSTRVLGTKFNVNALPDEEQVTVTVVSGRVRVDTSENQFKSYSSAGIVLAQNQQIKYHTRSRSIVRSTVDAGSITSWVDDVLEFHNASENEVFEQLENWYGVKFKIAGISKDAWDLDGKYDNKSLEFVLNSIGYTMGFEFTIQPDKKILIIYSNKPN